MNKVIFFILYLYLNLFSKRRFWNYGVNISRSGDARPIYETVYVTKLLSLVPLKPPEHTNGHTNGKK